MRGPGEALLVEGQEKQCRHGSVSILRFLGSFPVLFRFPVIFQDELSYFSLYSLLFCG